MKFNTENPVVRDELWEDYQLAKRPKHNGYYSQARYNDEDFEYDEDAERLKERYGDDF